MRSRFQASLALAAILALGLLHAQATRSQRQAVDRIFQPVNRKDGPGCAVAAMKKGHVLFARGYGRANLEYGIRLKPSSAFHAASVSKQFTAFAVRLLEEEGKLSLEGDIRRWIPEIPDYGTPVTVGQLIHHTSGLRDQWDLLLMAGWRWEADVVRQEDVLHLASRQKALNFQPGSAWLYSNTGYTLLAVIVERITGRSLRRFADERIFKPLEMKQTVFRDDHEMIVPGRAYAYAAKPRGGWRISIPDFDVAGATSLFTTVRDMARWDANFNTGKVGGREVIERMLRPGRLSDGRELEYASGLILGRHRGLPTVSHGGADAGYRAHFLRYPEQRFAVAVFCNSPDGNPAMRAHQTAEVFLGDMMGPPRKASGKDSGAPADLESYEGLYRHPSSDLLLSVRRSDPGLTVAGRGLLPLHPRGNGRFAFGDRVEVAFSEVDGGVAQRMDYSTPLGTTSYRRHAKSAPAPEQLKEYAGTYYSAELDTRYRFHLRGRSLLASHRKLGSRRCRPTIEDGFVVGGRYYLTFSRGAAGQVDGFTISTWRARGVRFERLSEKDRPGG